MGFLKLIRFYSGFVLLPAISGRRHSSCFCNILSMRSIVWSMLSPISFLCLPSLCFIIKRRHVVESGISVGCFFRLVPLLSRYCENTLGQEIISVWHCNVYISPERLKISKEWRTSYRHAWERKARLGFEQKPRKLRGNEHSLKHPLMWLPYERRTPSNTLEHPLIRYP